jgi:uncharacterized membrane protein (DUF2068 family)
VTHRHLGIRIVAVLEAAKGLAVLLAGSGLLFLVHRDVQGIADRLVAHLHLNPANHYSQVFHRAMTEATPGRIQLVALGALVYAGFRLAEAWGLWHERRWAEWLGVTTGLLYVPFEGTAFARYPGPEPAAALAANVAIVLVLAWQLHARAEVSSSREVPR